MSKTSDNLHHTFTLTLITWSASESTFINTILLQDLLLLELIDILMGVACEGSTSVSSRQVALNCVQLLVQRVTATHSQKIMKVSIDIFHSQCICY